MSERFRQRYKSQFEILKFEIETIQNWQKIVVFVNEALVVESRLSGRQSNRIEIIFCFFPSTFASSSNGNFTQSKIWTSNWIVRKFERVKRLLLRQKFYKLIRPKSMRGSLFNVEQHLTLSNAGNKRPLRRSF